MKSILVLALIATLGVLAAGCGSGKKPDAGPMTISGTTTIARVTTGTPIRCSRGGGAAVPPVGQEVSGIADPVPGSSGSEIRLTRRQDGSVVVVCRR